MTDNRILKACLRKYGRNLGFNMAYQQFGRSIMRYDSAFGPNIISENGWLKFKITKEIISTFIDREGIQKFIELL